MKHAPVGSWNDGLSTDMQMNYTNFKWMEDINFWKSSSFKKPKKIFVEYSNSIQEPNEQVLCPVIRDSIWIYIFVINKQIPSWRGQPASWRERWSTVDTQSAGCKILGNLE